MPKASLFGQFSVIAIFGTQGVIFQRFTESAKINAHKRSTLAHVENVVISPNLGDRDFWHPRCDFPKVGRIG